MNFLKDNIIKESNSFLKWFDAFIKEKNISNVNFDIQYSGATHHIDSEQIIDIIRQTSSQEQKEIKNIMVKIDFCNGDINHFLKHLAFCYIQNNY